MIMMIQMSLSIRHCKVSGYRYSFSKALCRVKSNSRRTYNLQTGPRSDCPQTNNMTFEYMLLTTYQTVSLKFAHARSHLDLVQCGDVTPVFFYFFILIFLFSIILRFLFLNITTTSLLIICKLYFLKKIIFAIVYMATPCHKCDKIVYKIVKA